MNRVLLLVSLGVFLISRPLPAAGVSGGGTELKSALRGFFSELSKGASEAQFQDLPKGLAIFKDGPVTGIVIDPYSFLIKPHVWKEPIGLDQVCAGLASGNSGPIAGINGAFYSGQGVLGQVVVDGVLPAGVRQLPSKRFPRCFLGIASVRGRSKWVIGETLATGPELLSGKFAASFSLPEGTTFSGILGGGGWIVRKGKDVHMEAYRRQNFRFRKVDQDSRHSVVAIDEGGRLYLLVCETGWNLERISEFLRSGKMPGKITDAMFLDGGSSSTIVLKGKYLVAPLYLMDKARFSCLLVYPSR